MTSPYFIKISSGCPGLKVFTTLISSTRITLGDPDRNSPATESNPKPEISDIFWIPIFTVRKPSTLLLIFSCVVVIEVSTILGEVEVVAAMEIWQTEQGADKMEVSRNVYVVLTSDS